MKKVRNIVLIHNVEQLLAKETPALVQGPKRIREKVLFPCQHQIAQLMMAPSSVTHVITRNEHVNFESIFENFTRGGIWPWTHLVVAGYFFTSLIISSIQTTSSRADLMQTTMSVRVDSKRVFNYYDLIVYSQELAPTSTKKLQIILKLQFMDQRSYNYSL